MGGKVWFPLPPPPQKKNLHKNPVVACSSEVLSTLDCHRIQVCSIFKALHGAHSPLCAVLIDTKLRKLKPITIRLSY